MSATTSHLLLNDCCCATSPTPPLGDSSMILREQQHPLCRGDDDDENGEEEDEADSKGRIPPSRFGSIAIKLILLGLVLVVFAPSDDVDDSSASPIANNASARVMFHQSRPWGNTISIVAFYFAASVIYSEVLMDRLLLVGSHNKDDNGSKNSNLSSIVVMVIKHLPELLLVALLGVAFGFRKNGLGADFAYFTFSCFTPWLVAVIDALSSMVPEHGGGSDAKRTTSQSYHWIAQLALPLALLVVTHATLFRDNETAIEFFRSPSYVNYCLSTTFMTCYFFRHVAGPFLFGNGKSAAGVAALLVQVLVVVPPTAIIMFPSLINAKNASTDDDRGAVLLACDYLIRTTICLDVVTLLCFCAKTFFRSCCCNKVSKTEKETTTTKEQFATLSSDDDYVLMVDDGRSGSGNV